MKKFCNYKKHGGQDRDGSRCNEVYWWVIGTYMHHAWLTHTFHHTSPILSLMYWKAQCMNALHTMHHHYLLFIITYICIHRPGIPPPLYVNTELIRAHVPAYNLQVNAHPLHIGTQCLI